MEAGSCFVELSRRTRDEQGGLVGNAFFANPSSLPLQGSLGRPFCLYFFVGILSSDKGLVGWNQLRRSSKSATIMTAMAAEGVRCGGWTTIALITHQAQPVVCSLQVVDHHPFILALFPTPGAVGEAGKMLEGMLVMDTH